jgi:hypothetical protein
MAVYDTSYTRPAPTLLKPGDGIILYCSRTPEKVPSVAEVDAYRAYGITVGFVFEDSADRAATTGYNTGKSDGQLAAQQAQAKDHPKNAPIYFACDVIDPVNLDYCRGFKDGLAGYYEPRLYAGDRNLERARAGIGLRLGWQASAGSWSDNFYRSGQTGGHGTYPGASLYQVIGTSTVPGTDINLVNNPAWNGATTDMAYLAWPDADKAALVADLVHAILNAGTTAPQYPDQPAIPLGVRIAEIDRHVGIDLPAQITALTKPTTP